MELSGQEAHDILENQSKDYQRVHSRLIERSKRNDVYWVVFVANHFFWGFYYTVPRYKKEIPPGVFVARRVKPVKVTKIEYVWEDFDSNSEEI